MMDVFAFVSSVSYLCTIHKRQIALETSFGVEFLDRANIFSHLLTIAEAPSSDRLIKSATLKFWGRIAANKLSVSLCLIDLLMYNTN
jgi:hypothetical protein